MQEHHGLTAQPRRCRLAHAESKSGGHRRIERVSPCLEHLDAGLGRLVMRGGDNPSFRDRHTAGLVKRTFVDVTFSDDVDEDLTNMRRLHAGEISEFTMEKRYYHKNGSIVWVKLTVSPAWKPNEEPTFHIAVVEDITERKKVENALRLERDRAQGYLNTAM